MPDFANAGQTDLSGNRSSCIGFLTSADFLNTAQGVIDPGSIGMEHLGDPSTVVASRHDDFDPPIEMDPQRQPTRPRAAAQVEYRVGGVVGLHP